MIVKTMNSTYKVDFEDGTVVRYINPTHGPLRRDGAAIPFDNLYKPQVDYPWRMILNLRDDGVQTERITSYVTEIEDIEEWEAWNDLVAGK